MYNPDYCSRPHVVALNKMDLEDAGELRSEVANEVLAAAKRLADEHGADAMRPPAAVVAVSAAEGEGLGNLAAALQRALEAEGGGEGGGQTEVLLVDGGVVMGGEREAWEVSDDEEEQEVAAGEGEGEEDEDEGWDEETAAAAARWQAILEAGEAAGGGPGSSGGGSGNAGKQQQQQQQQQQEEEEEDEGVDDRTEMAPADDEDAWLLDLSEEELLRMEVD